MRKNGKTIPSLEYVMEALRYDPETGIATWRDDRPSSHFSHARTWGAYKTQFAGKSAGGLGTDGYIRVVIGGYKLLLHRVICAMSWGVEISELPPQIDHEDLDTTNNKASNLRPAGQNQNQHNKGTYANNTSGFKGVSWHKGVGKWAAGIRVNSRRHHLGYFHDPQAAHAAYVRAANDNFGEFARAA